MNTLPFRTLLYRYFFAGWLFDGGCRAEGPLAELDVRGHQHRQAAWLPVYATRWFFCAVALCLGGLAAGAAAIPTADLLLYAASIACMARAMSLASTWAKLRRC